MASDISFSKVRRLLEQNGWALHHITGSHHIFKKAGKATFSVPVHRGKVKEIYFKQAKNITRTS
ncbi:MAG: type II toxin-antitoxin system HicA family toxin [Phycisphaerales bacterium]|nr:type II toxin-antitoxin system HicA family toxin [Planctomycetota bacterium]MBL6997016.1 type II toxin-antitoxin system HicA family toxin [Phycisphaerales bacterium]